MHSISQHLARGTNLLQGAVDLILDADIIAAALVFFEMADINDTPTKHSFSNEMGLH